jgi:hypothetical protein
LAVAALLPQGAVRLFVFTILTGLAPALCLRRRWRVTELATVAPTLSLLLWPLLTLGCWAAGAPWALRWLPGLVALAIALASLRNRGRRTFVSLTPADTAAVALVLVVALPVTAVFSVNGPARQGGEDVYLMRNWVAADSCYLFALTQEAVERRAYPPENPHLAGVGNYYPSLAHCGLAGLTMQGDDTAPFALWQIGPLIHLATAALLFHAILRRFSPRTTRRGILAALGCAFAFILVRPDLFLYPQTQSFVFGFLFLLIWLLGPGARRMLRALLVVGFGMGLILCFSHTVTAAAALILLAAETWSCLRTPRTKRRGITMAAGFAALAIVFHVMNRQPFPGEMGGRFDADALRQFRDFLLPYAPLIGGVIYSIAASRGRRRTDRTIAVLLLLAGAAYALYGVVLWDRFSRFFAMFNAQRFIHLALLGAAPLLCRLPAGRIAAALGVIIAGALVFPNPSAVETIQLVTGEPIGIRADVLRVFERIRRETPPEARIITSLQHHALPAFTGRAQYPYGFVIKFGLNTIPAAEGRRRLRENDLFFSNKSPARRIDLMDEAGLTHVLVMGDWSDDTQAREWADASFPTGTVAVDFVDGRLMLLERRKMERQPPAANRQPGGR